ncbi:LOW QUALITY PROTEIN: reverse transcriptase [Phytophthora megakarya]|uniref:Reverse transcriptase n=1 Tax=Phytophthora megakarya TaxID=4795 RepID=A0A225VHR4_9STRA|nr:LOW QUALITY PROTEIN: reverse transcriptase [Phytophthora megakarya]
MQVQTQWQQQDQLQKLQLRNEQQIERCLKQQQYGLLENMQALADRLFQLESLKPQTSEYEQRPKPSSQYSMSEHSEALRSSSPKQETSISRVHFEESLEHEKQRMQREFDDKLGQQAQSADAGQKNWLTNTQNALEEREQMLNSQWYNFKQQFKKREEERKLETEVMATGMQNQMLTVLQAALSQITPNLATGMQSESSSSPDPATMNPVRAVAVKNSQTPIVGSSPTVASVQQSEIKCETLPVKRAARKESSSTSQTPPTARQTETQGARKSAARMEEATSLSSKRSQPKKAKKKSDPPPDDPDDPEPSDSDNDVGRGGSSNSSDAEGLSSEEEDIGMTTTTIRPMEQLYGIVDSLLVTLTWRSLTKKCPGITESIGGSDSRIWHRKDPGQIRYKLVRLGAECHSDPGLVYAVTQIYASRLGTNVTQIQEAVYWYYRLLLRKMINHETPLQFFYRLNAAAVKAEVKFKSSSSYSFRYSINSKEPVGAGRPTGNAVTRVYNGHAVLRTADPSERESHCRVPGDMPNLVILKFKSMTKREDSLRVLVDSDASNNFVRQQCLSLLDFEEEHVPRSQLEVRLATGAILKRVIRARFSYKHRMFVEELLVLDLGMPWFARHDPIIDWEKRMVVRFGRRSATESDGPVSAADTPKDASELPIKTVATTAVSSRSARGARAVTTPGVVDRKGVSGQGLDTAKKFSAVRRRGDDNASTPGVDATSCVDGCNRPALKLACCRAAGLHEAGRDQAGLDETCPQIQEHAGDRPQTGMSAGGIKKHSSMAGPGRKASESGIHKKKRRRKHNTLRKSRSRTEILQDPRADSTLNVLTRACAGYQYKKVKLENPPNDTSELTLLPVMSWKRFAKDLYDGCIEQLCILSNREKMTSEAEELSQLFAGSATESEDTLSAKTKKEHFEEQTEILREHKDVLPDEIPAELPQDKGIQHDIDLVPGTKYCVTREWSLPRKQVKAIDDFFESRRKDKCGNQSPRTAHQRSVSRSHMVLGASFTRTIS